MLFISPQLLVYYYWFGMANYNGISVFIEIQIPQCLCSVYDMKCKRCDESIQFS